MNKQEIYDILDSCRGSFRVLPTREMMALLGLANRVEAELQAEAAIEQAARDRAAEKPKPILDIPKKKKKKAKKK